LTFPRPCATLGRPIQSLRAIALEQEALIRQVYRANPHTVVVLISSFSFAIPWTQRHVPAIVHLTHNSQELGNGLADVLFGDVNPGGRLVQTWPLSIEQLPPRLDYDLRKGRTYMYFQGEPLYPFGHGLSYTAFRYEDLRTSADRLAPGGTLMVSVDVTNTGTRAGDEVVQLYVRYPGAAVPRPLQELKGVHRIHLEPGARKTVAFTLHTHQLGTYDEGLGYAVHPGTVEVLVGRSSRDLLLASRFEIAGQRTQVDRVFFSNVQVE